MSFAKPTHYVVSAGYTDDGAVAYLRADGTWSGKLAEAGTWATEAEAQAQVVIGKKQERIVCDPYVFGVKLDAGVIDPMTAREAIRAKGPTTPIRRPDR
jgi:hypothetical protein